MDDRRVISGILHRFREGLRWRAVPAEYGPRTTLFNRFNRWSEKGIWQELQALRAEGVTTKRGKPITKGDVYKLLSAQVYVGQVTHKGTSHRGE